MPNLSHSYLTNQLQKFSGGTKLITMIAVGVGIAPMIHTLRAIFRRQDRLSNQPKFHTEQVIESPDVTGAASGLQFLNIKVKLLYGVVRGKKFYLFIFMIFVRNLFCITLMFSN